MTGEPTQILITVLSGDSTAIHLMASDGLTLGRPLEQLTLCRQPVECHISTQSFHRLGCPTCATEAVRSGVTTIVDRRQTAVNLPRFLAALRPAEVPAGPVVPMVPDQRERL